MAVFVMSNGAEVFRPHAGVEKADKPTCWTGQHNVLQHDEKHLFDEEMVKFPGPLMRADMPKDQLMRFIQAKCQECLRHLDNPDHQKSFFFWSIMEHIINKNGKVMMPEIATVLFKGHGLLRRKLGRVVNQEHWCLPLAELLCSTAPRNQLREEIITMGDDFASRGWWHAAQICCVIAGMTLGERPHFRGIGCKSLPQRGELAAFVEMMEKSEVYEFALSLTSAFPEQLFFQEIKLLFSYELDDAGHSALALSYCKSIFREILNFPEPPEFKLIDLLLKQCENLLEGKEKEPKWVRKLRWMVEELSGPPEFDPSEHKEFDSRFTMGELLGEGGFGSVFAGVRKADGKEVAIKCEAKRPDSEFITIPGETSSLPLEVALLKMVSEPPRCKYVIEMLEWFETPTHFILVLERPNPCMDLLQFCEDHDGRLPEAVAKEIMWQVVEAARHCCDRGVLHRDIKAQNILINPHTLEIKLIDFGCGDLLKDDWYKEIAGTEGFWPFEWVQWGKYHGVPATIWSLGVVLFDMVCGRLPFLSDEELIEADLTFSPDLSIDCCDLISWCLKRDPKYRASFQDILNHDWFKP